MDVHKGNIKYTSFVIPNGQYDFRKVPFGLSNSPSVFTRYVNSVFHELQRDGILQTYVDDIIISTKTAEENLEKLRKVFEVAHEDGEMSVSQTRGMFFRTYFEMWKNSTVKRKIGSYKRFPEPHNVKQVQSFLGLARYFGKFVADFSRTARPLTELTKKDNQFKFSDAERNAFESLKRYLCDKPILNIFDPQLKTELQQTPASMG